MPDHRMPRLPRACPVFALYVCADNDVNGNPRRGWAIHEAATGYFAEFVEEGYVGTSALTNRYPWFGHSLNVCERMAIIPAHDARVNVAPAEFNRWTRRDAVQLPSVAGIIRRADRCERAAAAK